MSCNNNIPCPADSVKEWVSSVSSPPFPNSGAKGRIRSSSRRAHWGISRQHMGAIEAPNMILAVSLDVLFNVATVLEIEPYLLLKFSPDK